MATDTRHPFERVEINPRTQAMTGLDQKIITKTQLCNDLQKLGVPAGEMIMLHASVKAIGWVVGGPDTVIRALLDVLTPAGTLMMYVSWEEWERSLVALSEWPKEQQQIYRESCPPFDPAASRAMREWSILTEYLRTWPGALRSDHPTASVAAVGAKARWLTENHPLQYGYGVGSPFAKLCEAGGKVLALGSPLPNLTLLHYAEHLVDIPNKRVVTNQLPVLRDGQRVWISFEEFDTCDGIRDWPEGDYFEIIAREYLAAGKGMSGQVGAARSYLFDATELVAFGIRWMEKTWAS